MIKWVDIRKQRNFDIKAIDTRFLSRILFKVGQIDSLDFNTEFRGRSGLGRHLAYRHKQVTYPLHKHMSALSQQLRVNSSPSTH